ncbi:type I methionyl aminopeptidase [Geminicoccus roseus]|uniref:type I methionyl aminopeptidase n=1 Tax=Geminicoccus roseus TaxID=404900 RepID=UPI001F0A791F|nr:type I methionyl aminopeptidase [Geminicoccus roseus]
MRDAGRLAAATLDMIAQEIRPGVASRRLDALAETFIRDHGAVPAPLGYRGYPFATCMSPNQVVCHGMPDERPLAEGDILKVDVTVKLDGWHGDSCRTFAVGAIDPERTRLLQTTRTALALGLEAVRPGGWLSAIGRAIQGHVEAQGYAVVRSYCGHGIGREFHQPPQVLHHLDLARDVELRPGMFFTIEPMVNTGGHATIRLEDGWTVVTADGGLSAQFEHTVGVTETGVEVFTLSPAG